MAKFGCQKFDYGDTCERPRQWKGRALQPVKRLRVASEDKSQTRDCHHHAHPKEASVAASRPIPLRG